MSGTADTELVLRSSFETGEGVGLATLALGQISHRRHLCWLSQRLWASEILVVTQRI